MKLIDKNAVVAEIERRLWLLVPKVTFYQQRVELEKLLSFIDPLEVKEIDFHKELLSFYRHTNDSGSEIALAKHFYELGFKAAQNEQKSCTTDE